MSGPRLLEGSPSETYRVGVVGAGYISRTHHLPILSNMSPTDIEFIVDMDRTRAVDLSRTHGGQPIGAEEYSPAELPDCDVMLLAIPVGARKAYVDEFGSRGTAIFTEKPFAVGSEMHRKFQALVEDIACNYMRVNYSCTQQLQELVESSLLGSLQHVVWREGEIRGATNKGGDHYQTDASLSGGGILLQNGCHPLSQLSTVFREWDLSVTDGTVLMNGDLDVDVDATIVATLADRTVDIDFELSRVRPLGRTAEFQFEAGTVTVDPFEPGGMLTIGTEDGTEGLNVSTDSGWATSFTQAHYLRWNQFLRQLVGQSAHMHPQTGIRVTELITNLYASERSILEDRGQ